MKRRTLLWLSGLAAAGLTALNAKSVRSAAGNRYYHGPVSDHFDGRVFFNPHGEEPRGLADLLKWQLVGEKTAWPVSYPSPYAGARPERSVEGDKLRVTMVGHATLLIQVNGRNILTDPIWSERASPVPFAGPKRVNPPGIAFEHLPPIDLVLISHNHYDHLDTDTLGRLVAAHDPLIVTPLGNDTIIHEAVPQARIVTGDWGDLIEADGLRIHIEPSHHWSARGMGDRRMALWASFVLETTAGRIYHIGDTSFHDGINYRAARAKHGGFRLAILPIGAYEPRWFMQTHHQNPEEAVEALDLCHAEFAVGHHWGTFQLTNEGIDEPLQALRSAIAERGIDPARFRALVPGESWEAPAGTA